MRNTTSKEVQRWTELGAWPGVICEVRGHYWSNRSTKLTWCYNHNRRKTHRVSIKNLIVKWQNTTWSWSGEPELTEGTWLQLMCCTPSRSCCPKFWSNRVHGVYGGIPEYTREDGEDGETRGLREWVHYGWYKNWSYHTWSFVYVSMGMNVSMKRKDNKTVMGHNKHNNQKWNITRSPEFRIRDKAENGEQ